MGDEAGIPFVKKDEGGWMRLVRKRLPILEWGRTYDRTAAVADAVAGITLGLTLVPQSIAYASLANLPVQYGLYSAYIGTMLYVVLGTVKEVSIGPTSLMALLTLQLCNSLPVEFVVLLTFLSGCVVLAMGLLRLGFLVDLISPSVTSGFTSATAVIIVLSQLKGLLGLSFTAESVMDNVQQIVAKWGQVRLPDCVLGAVCCTVLLLLRIKLSLLTGKTLTLGIELPAGTDSQTPLRTRPEDEHRTHSKPGETYYKLKDIPVSPKRVKLKKTLWLISIGRNALVVLSTSTFAYFMHDPAKPLFKLSGRVEPGVPRISLPPFSATVNNSTVGFLGMAQELGSGLVMMPIVMVLANIAIAKAFSTGGRVDATQEMLTLGLCNIAGSMLHAMPTCGAFTRSAVSHSSGVRSPLAGLYSGIITLLALIFLTQYFYFIPKACLSSVLICAVIFMIDIGIVGRLWRRDRAELAVLALTFCVSVARTVELAVLVGVVASLAVLLRRVMRPQIHMHTLKTACGEVVVVRPSFCLCYLNAELVSRRVLAAAAKRTPVLLDCAELPLLDYSAQQVLERLVKKAKSSNQKLLCYHVPESIMKAIENIDGIDKRPLRATTAVDALRSLTDYSKDDETSGLLAKELQACGNV